MRGWSRCLAFAAILGFMACGPSARKDGDGGTGPDGATGDCAGGATRCVGNTFQVCVDGMFVDQESCGIACDNNRGCVVCLPGTGTCTGDISHSCLPDGSGYEDIYCDPAQGVTCDMKSGICEGTCSPQNLGTSYIGCEYYPTVTGNDVSNDFQFAVAVSNTSSAVANVTIEDGALTAPLSFNVAPGEVQVQYLPWVEALKLCNTTPGAGSIECGTPPSQTDVLAPRGAYHLRSNQPVTVYQFSPLDYAIMGMFGLQNSYTNDASLLIPTNAWTGNYVVAAWPTWDFSGLGWPGLMAITAQADNTTVSIVTRTSTNGSATSPPFIAGTPGSIVLNRGDVLELTSWVGDLTGSIVSSDKPVQVIGGHYCTNVPSNIPYCDHIEESMFPVETLSTKYIVTSPALPAIPAGKVEVIRVIATAQNTELVYDPPQPGFPTSIAGVGDFIEIPNVAADFQISANHKILVAQYMEGQEAGGGTGDPAMALAVAVDQYRLSYLFHAPTNYEVNYVNITAPLGSTVMLDGMPLTGFTTIGATGFGFAKVTLGTGTAGNHTVTSDVPFGISVYGYGQYTSYWYPGGLDLAEIPVP